MFTWFKRRKLEKLQKKLQEKRAYYRAYYPNWPEQDIEEERGIRVLRAEIAALSVYLPPSKARVVNDSRRTKNPRQPT